MFRHSFLLALVACVLTFSAPAEAKNIKPDDSVVFDLSAEDWVVAQKARVRIAVEATVTGDMSNTLRPTILKSSDSIAPADWRIVSFHRNQDQSGMERWSLELEALLPENKLNGIHLSARRISKAGLNFSVRDINFGPTRDEVEAKMSDLRVTLYAKVQQQLDALNKALPNRSYRIALIDFTSPNFQTPQSKNRNRSFESDSLAGMAVMSMASGGSLTESKKIALTAHVVLSAAEPVAAKSSE